MFKLLELSEGKCSRKGEFIMLKRRRFFGSINSIIFSMLIIVGLVFGSSTVQAKKVYRMKFNTQMPAGDAWSIAQKWYFDNVMKNSDGRIKFQYFYSGSLTKVGEDLHAINSGLQDIGLISPGYTPTQLPLSLGMDLSYTSLAADAKSKAILAMYKESQMLRDEWTKKNNCKLLFTSPADILGFFSRTDMPTLASVKGKKVRTYGMVADALARLGGTPVSLPISGSYEAASRGIVDAVSGMGLASGWIYKMHEPCPYVVDIGYGQYCQPYIAMNLDLWNSLPKDLQQLFMDWVPKEIDYTTKLFEQKEKEAIEGFLKAGVSVKRWSDSDKAKARQLVQPAQVNSWMKKQAKTGLDPAKTKVFTNRYLELLKDYEEKSTFLDGFTYWQQKYGK